MVIPPLLSMYLLDVVSVGVGRVENSSGSPGVLWGCACAS